MSVLKAKTQQTLACPAVVYGTGYWSGADVRVEFRPAPVDSGVVFVRPDLSGHARIPVCGEHRADMPRRTNLECGGASVEMVEHVLAALAGLEIDNCEIWVNQPEMPGCDGSAAEFVQAILAAGIVPQGKPARRFEVTRHVRIEHGNCWIEASPHRLGHFCIEYRLDYPHDRAIGRQAASVRVTPETFTRELAPCRTFLRQREAEELRSQGLGLHVSTRELLLFDDDGPVGNELRFPNECARHKALDVLGDLALMGRRISGNFVAYRSGHRLNAEMAARLLASESTPVRLSA